MDEPRTSRLLNERIKILVITAASLLPLAVIVVLVVAGVYVPVFRALGDLATQTMDEMIPLHELELALHRSTMAARDPFDPVVFDASVSSAAEHYGRLLEVIPSKDGQAVLQSSRRRWKTAERTFRDAAPESLEVAAARYAAEIEHLSSELDGLHAGLHDEIIDQIETASAAERRGILLITGAVALSLGVGLVGSVLITRDRRRLVDNALTDGLTGTANRKAFESKFGEMAAKNGPFALILFDIDRFKTINDTHGHATGDAALLAVVESAGASLRENDYLTRLGGDEFAVLAPGVRKGRPWQWRNASDAPLAPEPSSRRMAAPSR